MAKHDAPIIVIKRVKKGGHGHHGGAWKIAYADFRSEEHTSELLFPYTTLFRSVKGK